MLDCQSKLSELVVKAYNVFSTYETNPLTDNIKIYRSASQTTQTNIAFIASTINPLHLLIDFLDRKWDTGTHVSKFQFFNCIPICNKWQLTILMIHYHWQISTLHDLCSSDSNQLGTILGSSWVEIGPWDLLQPSSRSGDPTSIPDSALYEVSRTGPSLPDQNHLQIISRGLASCW